MARKVLPINRNNGHVFEALKSGKKSVETRAATPRYRIIETRDELIFRCGKEKLIKEVRRVKRFRTISSMTKEINYKEIMPWAKTLQDVKETYYSFPKYKEKIGKFGLIAFYLK